MNEPQRSTSVMDVARPDSEDIQMKIRVRRHGQPTEKSLRFTVLDFDIVDKQHLYRIRHVLGFDRRIDSVSIANGSGDVFVTFQHWQLLDEVIVTQVAKAIGDALGIAPGHIEVAMDRLD